MKQFFYRSLTSRGDVVSGTLAAATREAALGKLLAQGLTPLDISEGERSLWQRFNDPIELNPVRPHHVQEFFRDLSRLLKAGLSIDEALSLEQTMVTNKSMQTLVGDIRATVRKGHSLARALGDHPAIFTPEVLASVQAGEAAGRLGETLEEIAVTQEKDLQFIGRLRASLIYPILLLFMVVVTIILVVTVILPEFAPLFAGNEDKLPLLTRLALDLVAFFERFGTALMILGLVLALGLLQALRTPSIKAAMTRYLCRLPFLGPLLETPDLVRFARTLGVCLQSGMGLQKAMDQAVRSLQMVHIRRGFAAEVPAVRQGEYLRAIVPRAVRAPALLVQFIAVGEQTGTLAKMLLEAADLLEKIYESRLQRLLEVASPLLTILLGAIVALLVGAVLIGILSINELAL